MTTPSRFTFHRSFPQTILLVFSLFIASYSNAAPVYTYKVVATLPHSTDNYTEGFFYLDGMFYESTGIAGRSAVIVFEPQTGKTLQRRNQHPNILAKA